MTARMPESIMPLVRPELRRRARLIPHPPVQLRATRWLTSHGQTLFPIPRREGVELIRHGRTLIFRPRNPKGALMWLHGGGHIIGHPAQDGPLCANTAAEVGVTVVAPRYPLSPAHPFPAGLDAALDTWAWMHTRADEFGEPFAIGGESAGGGLAAAACQRLYDEHGPLPRAQWLFCPMLDDRPTADRRRDLPRDRPVANNAQTRYAWTSYLGQTPGLETVPEYAVPARRADLSGLPPAWLSTGDIELFYEEICAYTRRLRDAGVPAQLEIVEGAPHAIELWAFDVPVVKAMLASARAWLGEQL